MMTKANGTILAPLKPPLNRAATFMSPLGDQKNGQDAQWSPKPGNVFFCVTAAARPLCLPRTTKAVVVAQQVAGRRQSGGRSISNVAQGLSLKLIHNVQNSRHFLVGDQ